MRAVVKMQCEVCGGEFFVAPSRLKHGRGKHCSPACQYSARRAKPKKASRFECVGCGVEFERHPSWLKRKGGGKFCARACRDKHWTGALNPQWLGGPDPKRGRRWPSIRRRIIARDGGACVVCASSEQLHVHHVIPYRLFECKEVANDDENLVTLCPPCHRRTESRTKWVPLSGGALVVNTGGYAWQLARARGLL